MPKTTLPSIVVVGDVCVDVLETTIPPQIRTDKVITNWRQTGGLRSHFVPGGAMLLTRMLAEATGKPVAGPQLRLPPDLQPTDGNDGSILPDNQLCRLSSNEILQSRLLLTCDATTKSKDNKGQWRVKQCLGFDGPEPGPDSKCKQHHDLIFLPINPPQAKVLVLDDSGNDFRHNEKGWPAVLTEKGDVEMVMLKLNRPLPVATKDDNPLWHCVRQRAGDRLIVIVDANDLRLEGATISRGLSWEKTALDTLWHLRFDQNFAALRETPHLIVRFGLEGALYYQFRGYDTLPQATLIYDPRSIEGELSANFKNGMVGRCSAFTAWLTAALLESKTDLRQGASEDDTALKERTESVKRAIIAGLAAARRLFVNGFGTGSMPAYPDKEILGQKTPACRDFATIKLPIFNSADNPDPQNWTILDTILPPGSKLESVAQEAMCCGSSEPLDKVPLGVFNKMRSSDRFEIEAYRSICAIMGEYLHKPNAKRPLSIAVFGPPGSGKSFGVQQVAEHICGDVSLEVMPPFNLSQFRSHDELIQAFHLVRDCTIRQRIPLVFFDEFDSDLDGKSLGWLKHFLAPMQDGLFMDCGTMRPIGKAIFIFAGGTSSSFGAFQVDPAAGALAGVSGKSIL